MQYPRGERGSTLLDAVVGTALMLVVFVGIAGAFRLAVITVSHNKARAGAIALANERLEYVRSLSYAAIGVTNGIPAGAIPQTETVELNDVVYTRRTFVSYEDDAGDGLAGADSNGVVADYKSAKASVSWDGREGTHTITLVTRISPPTGIESAVPGGVLALTVINAQSQPVANASVRVVNGSVSPVVDMTTYTDTDGIATIIGAPAGSGYQILATKAGYSSAQTYSASATNTNPTPAHLGVSDSQTTAATFAIDILGSKVVETYRGVSSATTTEPFADESLVASSTNVAVQGSVAQLSGTEGSFPAQGTIISTAVSTSSLVGWKTFSWNDSQPLLTEIRYRLYDGSGATLVPDAQVAGNSAGLTSSPVDLRNVSTSSFPSLAVHATLATQDASTTPFINSWSIAYDYGPTPMANVTFAMRGAKTIGTTAGGSLLYKYDNSTLATGSNGSVTLSDIEWDSYTVSIPASTGYDASSFCAPQPETLSPGTSHTTRVFLVPHTTHSLLVDVRASDGAVIAGATARLYRGAYDTTIATDACGHVFYSALSSGTVGSGNAYTIEVSAPGYTAFTSSEVNVSGTSKLSVILNN